jgi:mannose-6-phosphate isomerase-like protein (cupin superfamily)
LSNEPISRPLSVVGDQVRILLGGAQTGGTLSIVEDVTPPGGGPPPHVHRREDEAFFVIEGDVEFMVGDRWVRVAPGSCFFAKRDIPHTFRNAGSKPCRMLTTITPAGFEEFFVEADRISANGPPTPDQLVAVGKRFGLEFLPPP